LSLLYFEYYLFIFAPSFVFNFWKWKRNQFSLYVYRLGSLQSVLNPAAACDASCSPARWYQLGAGLILSGTSACASAAQCCLPELSPIWRILITQA
jgi:hypothetical protein